MNFFGKCKFELHVHRLMEFNDSKNDTHGIECSVAAAAAATVVVDECDLAMIC